MTEDFDLRTLECSLLNDDSGLMPLDFGLRTLSLDWGLRTELKALDFEF